MFKRFPPYTKNFFFISGILFFVWMLFIDNNHLISQIKLRAKLSDLEHEKAYFEDRIEEVKLEREALLTDKDLLERFAREKYFMKKDNEDLYILVEEEK
jgi:cell division protein DivIC